MLRSHIFIVSKRRALGVSDYDLASCGRETRLAASLIQSTYPIIDNLYCQ